MAKLSDAENIELYSATAWTDRIEIILHNFADAVRWMTSGIYIVTVRSVFIDLQDFIQAIYVH
ncbi:hypothetical protein CANTEDRAFT_114150 [Yamadazyma tenuis ATCC 10573]|uniref:Uncharacterized protein n=1 Tax=Candida tenuis (strain ATCC 10573 / BCRC 21748 / CBS 615 / JCM 9827 / NBRC 10315 / NRRL Y-1498 / VKM Y-70) TaxID=590646 RepID=G3B3B0_CANTC|nr:uncharacterized protein CANTEDRAFT_114150 [Yamadazyma tenuis ATCC 10573]EGV64125.1 hypothetical protein CANTEDRAFT_114150 [Yamadazyma tenuis ATCC 10573]